MIITKEIEFYFEQFQDALREYRTDKALSRKLTPHEQQYIVLAWEEGTGHKFDRTCGTCWAKALRLFSKVLDKQKKPIGGASYTSTPAKPSNEIKKWVDDNLKIEKA